jgi:DNA-binding NarL/FixJ family response regulator
MYHLWHPFAQTSCGWQAAFGMAVRFVVSHSPRPTRSASKNLLLTDVIMPGMSGAELSKRIAIRVPGVKVLFMSGYIDDSVVRQGISENETAFPQKPFTPLSLAKKVREVLDGAAVR